MARRVDDLLSIFDPNRSTGAGEGRGAATQRKKARAAGGKQRAFQGLVLSPKQVVLGGSAAALVLLLTFTLGLAVGRPGSDRGQAPSLRRDTQRMVRAEFPRYHPHTHKAMAREDVYEMLVQRFGVPARAVVNIRPDGDRMVIELGPFDSDDAAEHWIQKWGLQAAHLNLNAPFRYHQMTNYVSAR